MSEISTYMNDIGLYPLLTPEEEREIALKAKFGDREAQEKLVTSNLKLVVKMAKKYSNLGIPLLDIIQEGNMGLIRAAERFDPDKNLRFTTYAAFWIKQSILKHITSNRGLIRLPAYVYDGVSKVSKFIQEYKTKFDNFPTNEEICSKLSIKPKELERYLDILENKMSVGDEMYGNIAEYCSDILSNDTFEDDLIKKNASIHLMKKLNVLSPREKEILIFRYGLMNEKIMTLEELGERMQLTKERIRQIQSEAIFKLKMAL